MYKAIDVASYVINWCNDNNLVITNLKLQKLLYPFKILYSTEAKKKIRVVLEDFIPDVVHLNNINFQITPAILYEIRSFEKKSGKIVKGA